ncbi:hypothetical protein [Massilia sp. YMA4]|uniref:hypothetical protein n=1 Tax=Massilia sp. YMA4 TaxID=1593482 RepID=UPI001582125D|nr:hypothetical protein [Massilia sp. YMA4]
MSKSNLQKRLESADTKLVEFSQKEIAEGRHPSLVGIAKIAPVFGARKGILFRDRKLMGGSFTITVPSGHQFAARIALTEAALSQSATVGFRSNPGDGWHEVFTLGGDGPAGHQQNGNWLYSENVLVTASYRLSHRNWYFGDAKSGNGAILHGDEYENGVLIQAWIDDAGFWSSNDDGPDQDFNGYGRRYLAV